MELVERKKLTKQEEYVMSGSVKKIFTVLIVMVACVMIGALVLNVLMPNVTTSIVDALEQMVFNATGMQFNWNNNASSGTSGGGTDFQDGMAEDNTGTNVGNAGHQVEGLDQPKT